MPRTLRPPFKKVFEDVLEGDVCDDLKTRSAFYMLHHVVHEEEEEEEKEGVDERR